MPDPDEAQDLAQEIFISVGKALANGGVANPVAYLRTAAMNRLANWLRDRPDVVSLEALAESVPDPRRSNTGAAVLAKVADSQMMAADKGMCAERRKKALIDGIRRLPAGQRSAYVLTDVHGLTEHEAASLLRLRRSTLSTQRTRARTSLRDELLLADSC